MRPSTNLLSKTDAAALVAEAEAKTSKLTGRLRAHVAARLQVLADLSAADDQMLMSQVEGIGAAALEVAEVAADAGLVLAGEIACGLAALADRSVEQGAWLAEPIRRHLQALSLAGGSVSLDMLERELLTARLKAVRTAVGLVD